jgi:PST family polysaccharide transporter
MSEIGSVLKFSGRVLVSNAAWNSYQRLDNFTAGKVLGQAALGLYNAAWGLAFVPVEKIATLVLTVIPSYLAVVQKDPASLRRYLRVLSEAVALATFPATVGLALVAPELVPLVFGHQWLEMIAPLQVLCFYAGFRSVVALLSKVLTAVGDVRFVMWNDLAALVILPIAFYLGSYHGVAGIAWGWVVAYPLIAVPLFHKTFRTIDMKVDEYLRAVRPALEGTVAMVVGVELVKAALNPLRSLLVKLTLEVCAGAVIYVAVLWRRHGQRMSLFLKSLAKAWSRKKQLRTVQA